MTDMIMVHVDQMADAAYIRLSDAPVARTVTVREDINVDLDEFGVAVGVEALSIRAEIPFDDLTSCYHVRSEVVEMLRLIRPSIGEFVEVGTSTCALHGPMSTSAVQMS
jgi:uncharacterized protein YuzE